MTILSKKEFLNLTKGFLAVIGLGAVAGPVIAYFFPAKLEEVPADPVMVCPEEELPVNTAKTVRFGRYPAIIINTQAGLRAYSAVCTHFACITKWDPELGQIVCPCHEGYFDPQDGSVISGPPPTPLMGFQVEIVDGNIYVSAGEES